LGFSAGAVSSEVGGTVDIAVPIQTPIQTPIGTADGTAIQPRWDCDDSPDGTAIQTPMGVGVLVAKQGV
jgi:hypothetical protein